MRAADQCEGSAHEEILRDSAPAGLASKLRDGKKTTDRVNHCSSFRPSQASASRRFLNTAIRSGA
jgi:hypothetical protein